MRPAGNDSEMGDQVKKNARFEEEKKSPADREKKASDVGLWGEFTTGASLHHRASRASSCSPRRVTIKT